MKEKCPLKIYMVIGELSGDALGAHILSTYARKSIAYEFSGLAGPRMQALGVSSLFDISQLSMMGLASVIRNFPKLLLLIHRVVKDILLFKPDIIVLIDSPDFSQAVAKRIRKHNPDIPIVKYVCPSVWAWRQGRAKKMKAYIDHILAILPFEPGLVKELGGPPATYVGHPLSTEWESFENKGSLFLKNPVNLLLLPGSRKVEVRRLLPVIRDVTEILRQRNNVQFQTFLPAVDHLVDYITEEVSYWSVKPEIVIGKEAKQNAFKNANVALACSGTVMLELALSGIPTVSIYKLDIFGFIIKRMVKIWTACLPNIIIDKAVVPEFFDDQARPQLIVRVLEELCIQSPSRMAQIQGFALLRKIMQNNSVNEDLAALKILDIAKQSRVC